MKQFEHSPEDINPQRLILIESLTRFLDDTGFNHISTTTMQSLLTQHQMTERQIAVQFCLSQHHIPALSDYAYVGCSPVKPGKPFGLTIQMASDVEKAGDPVELANRGTQFESLPTGLKFNITMCDKVDNPLYTFAQTCEIGPGGLCLITFPPDLANTDFRFKIKVKPQDEQMSDDEWREAGKIEDLEVFKLISPSQLN